MIKPTVGRVVWFFGADWYDPSFGDGEYSREPRAAIITHVWHERMVNLTVFDRNGRSHGVTSVDLLQDDDPPGGQSYWCAWMPYQKGQAAKTEELEKKLGT